MDRTSAAHYGTSFSVDNAMTCHMGDFPTIRHNEICDITATLLTEICHNVTTESLLQPITIIRSHSLIALPTWN